MSKFQTYLERHFSLVRNFAAKVLFFPQLRKYFSIKIRFSAKIPQDHLQKSPIFESLNFES